MRGRDSARYSTSLEIVSVFASPPAPSPPRFVFDSSRSSCRIAGVDAGGGGGGDSSSGGGGGGGKGFGAMATSAAATTTPLKIGVLMLFDDQMWKGDLVQVTKPA